MKLIIILMMLIVTITSCSDPAPNWRAKRMGTNTICTINMNPNLQVGDTVLLDNMKFILLNHIDSTK